MQNIVVYAAFDPNDQEWSQAFRTALAQSFALSPQAQDSDVLILPLTAHPLATDQRDVLFTGLQRHRYLVGVLRAPIPRYTWPILHHLIDVIDVAPAEAGHRVALSLTHIGDRLHPPDPLTALHQGRHLALPERINACAELIALMQPAVQRFFASQVADVEQCDALVGDTSLAIAAILRHEPQRAAGLSPHAFVMQCAQAQLRAFRRPNDR